MLEEKGTPASRSQVAAWDILKGNTCCSVVEHVVSLHEVLCLISRQNCGKEKEQMEIGIEEVQI